MKPSNLWALIIVATFALWSCDKPSVANPEQPSTSQSTGSDKNQDATVSSNSDDDEVENNPDDLPPASHLPNAGGAGTEASTSIMPIQNPI